LTPSRFRFCDEFEHGFGWLAEDDKRGRTSHVLVAAEGVWLVDPVAWSEGEKRAGAAGEVRGVVQLLDRHSRDCAEVARRLRVAHHVVPADGVPGSPFEAIPVVRFPGWREVAIWWPDERVLLVPDALGTLPYFRAPGDRIGVHPLLRAFPPRALARFEPSRILCGHGEGIHEAAAPALVEALATARRKLPAAWLRGLPDLFRRG
jgi:hypothetical protein